MSFPFTKGRLSYYYSFFRYYLHRFKYIMFFNGYFVVFKSPLDKQMPSRKRIRIGLDFKVFGPNQFEELVNELKNIVPPWKLLAFKRRRKKGYHAIIGYSDGYPVSYCSFAEDPIKIQDFNYRLAPKEMYIFDAWVDPTYRGRGIGYYNFKFIFEFFKMRGYRSYMHIVEGWNRRMLRLCKKTRLDLYGILKHRSVLGIKRTRMLPPGKDEAKIARKMFFGTGLEFARGVINPEIITSQNGFNSIKQKWDELAVSGIESNFFLTHDWLSNWWENFGGENKLFIITGSEEHSLKSAFPFYLNITDGAPIFGGKRLNIPAKILEFIGTGISGIGDFIISGHKPLHLATMVDFLFGPLSTEWDIVDLHQIDQSSENLHFLLSVLRERGYSFHLTLNTAVPYLSIDKSNKKFTEILTERYPPKTESDYRREKKRIIEDLHPEFESRKFSPKEFIDIFEEIESKAAKGRTVSDVFMNAKYKNFLMMVLQSMEMSKDYYYVLLKANGEYSAYQFGFIYLNRYYSLNTAINSNFSKYPIENFLYEKMYDDLNQLDITEVDFREKPSFPMIPWPCSYRNQYTLRIFNNNLKGKFLKQTYKSIIPTLRFIIGRKR
ncbi:MAG: GNAT family N-acetyltransferase [candidate division Zixibacteria bacterium]|nr:GNAT family N-acetyltransferase [candidate division Zixibacteria bacterium]